jgi:hypothetical protein
LLSLEVKARNSLPLLVKNIVYSVGYHELAENNLEPVDLNPMERYSTTLMLK